MSLSQPMLQFYGAAREIEPTPQEKFQAFHKENPHVYEELLRLARQARSAGRNRCGIRMLWEVMRWNFYLKTTHAEHEPKLNDHYPPFYARLLMQREPELRDFFETRGRT